MYLKKIGQTTIALIDSIYVIANDVEKSGAGSRWRASLHSHIRVFLQRVVSESTERKRLLFDHINDVRQAPAPARTGSTRPGSEPL